VSSLSSVDRTTPFPSFVSPPVDMQYFFCWGANL
jgi:hypothetical protein